jgi:hypothetical protein
MNISTIVAMIQQTPEILDDIPGFIARMNEKNIQVVVKKRVVEIDESYLTSIAEREGGDCTEENIQQAIVFINKEPLRATVANATQRLEASIAAGEINDPASLYAAVRQIVDAAEAGEETPPEGGTP